MEYQVPQFIEIEDKIFGPFTLAQFIYIAGGIGLCAIFFVYLPLIIAIPLSLPVVAFAAALAFYKVNNKPFVDILQSGIAYFLTGKLYLWKKDDAPPESTVAEPVKSPEARAKLGLSAGRLHDLAWSLDVQAPGGEPEA